MEPETSTPKLGIEQAPLEYGFPVEQAPRLLTPELGGLEAGSERHEQAAEGSAPAFDNSGMSPILPAPMITAADPIATNVSAIGATPLAAADDDLIEKEWVDKAKKIVEETKDDPYRREQAVGQLQKDYLKKRYGRELGEA